MNIVTEAQLTLIGRVTELPPTVEIITILPGPGTVFPVQVDGIFQNPPFGELVITWPRDVLVVQMNKTKIVATKVYDFTKEV
ncbi:hypothetical protein WSM22_33510 [Cytophagales bacterium WSM2-2]|nr:hypothetical protein WSM22_33510 [Cytophagales bacterium WSM2-2]